MKHLFSGTFLFLSFLLFTLPVQAQCKVSKIVENGKLEIDPAYLYDGFTLSNFEMDAKQKHIQVEFTALKGQKYKLYFCNSGFTEEVKVSLYKQEKDDEQRTDLLGANTVKDQYIEFELNQRGTYIVDYTIPPCENSEYGMVKSECMVLLISYKEK